MTVKSLLNEHDLEIDDIRWYLSEILTERLLSHVGTPEELTRIIWSGELDDELYNMEERYLADMQEQMDKNTLDESYINLTMNEIRVSKRKRRMNK